MGERKKNAHSRNLLLDSYVTKTLFRTPDTLRTHSTARGQTSRRAGSSASLANPGVRGR